MTSQNPFLSQQSNSLCPNLFSLENDKLFKTQATPIPTDLTPFNSTMVKTNHKENLFKESLKRHIQYSDEPSRNHSSEVSTTQTQIYLISSKFKHNEKYKIRKLQEVRRPFHTEFKSAKNREDLFDNITKDQETLDYFFIIRKRRHTRSAQKSFSSDIYLKDLETPEEKLKFQVYADSEIGIKYEIQEQMIHNVIIIIYSKSMRIQSQMKKW